MKTAAIILNGVSLDREIEGHLIICADAGYNLLKGKKPDVIVGDFDSLSSVPSGLKVIRHNIEKNQTDGEICVEYAVNQGCDSINIYGALGGRMDHVLGNLGLLKLCYLLNVPAAARERGLDIYYFEKDFSLDVKKGETISIVPFAGDALIKQSKGLYYPLNDLLLKPHRTRGISNIAVDGSVKLEIAYGGVFVFHYFS
ncbi:MAG: thiamine diphosphokinase [Christensenellales bacterium]|jgi:thiamine pyrophosphokinase|nr:thiamine diphosphokinase [Clostridiales bacterium]